MINDIGNFIFNFCIVIMIFAFQIIKPIITRKEIYFGIRIPENERNNTPLKKVYKNYLIFNTVIFGIFIVIIMYIFNNYYASIEYTILILLYLLFTLVIYFISNKRVLKIKQKQCWNTEKKQIVTIDTNFSKEKLKILVSPWWFFVSLLIIIITIYIGFKNYDLLPSLVPTHWDFAGEINGYMMKSSKIIYVMPKFQIVTLIIFFTSYKIIGLVKQQLNTSNPQQSKEKNKKFRYIWSSYMVFSTIIINLFFLYANLIIFRVAQLSSKSMLIMLIIIIAILTSVFIGLSIYTGQGGSRLNFKDNLDAQGKMLDRNDDKYWKFGIFYINKKDPSIFIEKRFGVGWTVNLGRPECIVIVLGIVVLILLLPYILN